MQLLFIHKDKIFGAQVLKTQPGLNFSQSYTHLHNKIPPMTNSKFNDENVYNFD